MLPHQNSLMPRALNSACCALSLTDCTAAVSKNQWAKKSRCAEPRINRSQFSFYLAVNTRETDLTLKTLSECVMKLKREIYVYFAAFVKVLRSFSMTDRHTSLKNVLMTHKIRSLENTVAERESSIVSRY